MKKQLSIAIVNDLSGFGRCSTTTALPLLSAMKIQCGIVPTAILSNHTEYPSYTLLDFSTYMKDYLEQWKKHHFSFDGIFTGFLASKEQIDIIASMIHDFSFHARIIDPVMGDHGTIYDSYTKEMCMSMKNLVSISTLTTPNLTELCILTDTPYRTDFSHEEILDMCKLLVLNGAKQIVVTGIEKEDTIGNAIYENGNFEVIYTKKILPLRPGTGDVFSSILAGFHLHNLPIKESIKIASTFIETCLTTSSKLEIPINDGVCFEEHLDLLIQQFNHELA